MMKKVFYIVMCLMVGYVIYVLSEVGDYPEKIWLHRCNSMEKLYEKQEKFPNIEVDVTYRPGGWLDVTHDADTSFGLDVRSYFAYMQGKDSKIWLDMKNLNMRNAPEILAEVDELREEYDFPIENLIIESPCWKALGYFTKKGYYTSLYITKPLPSELTEQQVEKYVHYLRGITVKGIVRALSFPAGWYGTIRERLNYPVDLLTWQHRLTQFQLLLLPHGRKMLKDSRLKVILVKDKGCYHR